MNFFKLCNINTYINVEATIFIYIYINPEIVIFIAKSNNKSITKIFLYFSIKFIKNLKTICKKKNI